MKAKRKTTKAKKAKVRVRDIKPKHSPSGGKKHKHGSQPVSYVKYTFDTPLISS